MVVVTISILVTHLLSEEMYPEVRRLVSSPLEELVLSEVEERSSKRKSEDFECPNGYTFITTTWRITVYQLYSSLSY